MAEKWWTCERKSQSKWPNTYNSSKASTAKDTLYFISDKHNSFEQMCP